MYSKPHTNHQAHRRPELISLPEMPYRKPYILDSKTRSHGRPNGIVPPRYTSHRKLLRTQTHPPTTESIIGPNMWLHPETSPKRNPKGQGPAGRLHPKTRAERHPRGQGPAERLYPKGQGPAMRRHPKTRPERHPKGPKGQGPPMRLHPKTQAERHPKSKGPPMWLHPERHAQRHPKALLRQGPINGPLASLVRPGRNQSLQRQNQNNTNIRYLASLEITS